MIGLSTMGSISLGCALVAGRNRVPSPAAGNTALRTFTSGRPSPSRRRGLVLGGPHLDPKLLDPVPEAPLRDAEDLGGARLYAAGPLQGVQDQAPLSLREDVVE